MNRYRHVFVVALILAVLVLHSMGTIWANGPNWPQFRGPNASGHAAEGQNPPVQFGPEQNLLWKTPVSRGHSSPCIWGDSIFLTGYIKEKKELQVFCIDRNSGNIRWSRIVPVEQIEEVHSFSSPAASTPSTDGERVYVYFGSYGILCYDFTGEIQWTFPLPLIKTQDGHATSLIVSGDSIILNHNQPKDPYILAIDRKSGETVWKQSRKSEGTSHSTPVVWGQQLIIHMAGELVAYDLEDGSPAWSVTIATRGTSTPVIGNNVLFVGAWTNLGEPDQRVNVPDFEILIKKYDKNSDLRISKSEFPEDLVVARRPELGNVEGGQVYVKPFFQMIDDNKDDLIDETEWKGTIDLLSTYSKDHGLTAIKLGGKGDVTATHVLWQEKRFVPEVPSPLFYQERVYIIKNGGLISCMDVNSGKLIYRERLGAYGPYYSSPIVAHGRIYISSGKGVITVFKAGDNLEVLARNDLKEQIFATPAVVDNKLYVRTEKNMYAFIKAK